MDNALRKAAQAVWDNWKDTSCYSHDEEYGQTDYYDVDAELIDALGAALAEPEEWVSTNIAPDHHKDVEVLVTSRGHFGADGDWWILSATDGDALFWRIEDE